MRNDSEFIITGMMSTAGRVAMRWLEMAKLCGTSGGLVSKPLTIREMGPKQALNARSPKMVYHKTVALSDVLLATKKYLVEMYVAGKNKNKTLDKTHEETAFSH